MNKPLASSLASIVRLPVSPGIFIPSAPDAGTDALHRSLLTLERLRTGWRPDGGVLTAARRLERWSAVRRDGMAYQFIGFAASPAITSTIIATVLAIDPSARWALLFADRWVVLGAPSPAQLPLDSSDIMQRAEAWLRQTP
jgi:hypothetical protein